LDQACSHDGRDTSAAQASTAAAAADAAKQQQLVRRASKALLKQVEETRRKYTAEVEGLKAELQLLNKQAQKDRREADLASVTAAAAKKAALEATEELESINHDVLRAKRTMQQLNRCLPRAAAANQGQEGLWWQQMQSLTPSWQSSGCRCRQSAVQPHTCATCWQQLYCAFKPR
jgi:hypothetical protein